jgi:hypothetical protein
MAQEVIYQQNMEAVMDKALPLLTDQSKPEDVDDDWITNFFEKARSISDDDMQELWARILAGEANSPGSFSRRTVNCLSDCDKQDAELFVKLCGFVWNIGEERVPLIFDTREPIYASRNIDFSTLTHLNSAGLLKFEGFGDFQIEKAPQFYDVHYFGEPLRLTLGTANPNEARSLIVGKVMFTAVGHELAGICDAEPVEGFLDFVKEEWQQYRPQTPMPRRP